VLSRPTAIPVRRPELARTPEISRHWIEEQALHVQLLLGQG